MSVQQILKLIRGVGSITDWGKEFQSLITLTEKKDDLDKQFVYGLNDFMLCPLVDVIMENDDKFSVFML